MTQYDDCVLDDMSAIASLEIFWLLCWIGASIPLYMMCCCTEPPHMVRPFTTSIISRGQACVLIGILDIQQYSHE